MVNNERRRHRSQTPRVALTLQLMASQERLNAKAVVLADHHGRVIARSCHEPIADEVASFGPVVARPAPWSGRLRFDDERLDVAIAPVSLGSQTGYLCSLGGRGPNVHAELQAAGRGVRRILGDKTRLR